MIELALPTAEDTRRLGAALGSGWASAQPRAQSLHLVGELGAGKTTLAQALLAALGVTERVRSPTYSLLEVYETSFGTVVHADFYRLRGGAELEALGWRDYCVPGILTLIEWPEHGGAAVPAPDLHLALQVLDAGRRARLETRSAAGEAWLIASGITRNSMPI